MTSHNGREDMYCVQYKIERRSEGEAGKKKS